MRTILPLVAALLATAAGAHAGESLPNVVIVYADDLGYGDLSAYGATRFQTPRIDRLAAQGLRLTNAHAAAATCTPSRYAMLTGEYAWRRKGTGVLPGDARLIVEPGRTTLASVMKRAGYRTGVVGKWHLGLGDGRIDWNGDIRPGPREIGFDESFLVPATGDRVPCVYVENGRVRGARPEGPDRGELRAPGRGRPDREGAPRAPEDAPEPRARHDDRQRDQPHRLHERRPLGPLGGRGHGRRPDRRRPRPSSSDTATGRSSSTSPRTTSTCRACRTPASPAGAASVPAAT